MNKILVVEDEVNTADLLRRYFEIVGHEVLSAHTGAQAIAMAGEHLPAVIILDIMLPDMTGYDVCKRLRTNSETERIPIIFLTQKDTRTDRLEGLSLGADDYITKPFDIEELRLRVHNILVRMGGASFVDPRTGLPNVELTKKRLPKLLDNADMVFFNVRVLRFKEYTETHGPVAANQVIRGAAKLIGDVLHEVDPIGSFLGHPGDDRFLVAVLKAHAERVEKELPKRFGQQASKYYDYKDQARGHALVDGKKVEFVVLEVKRTKAETIRKEVVES
jgi:DNA-binding response OmpR family regulator